MRRSRDTGRAVQLPTITSLPVGDELGVGLVIHMLEKYLLNGSNGGNYLQFNMVRQLRVAVSYIYAYTYDANSMSYSLKSHHGIVLHIYEVVM